MSNDSTTLELAKRALIRYSFLRDLDGKDVNGARAYFLIAQQDTRLLDNGKTVGQAITETLHFMMLNFPGLVDMMYSPDGLLRRLRDAKTELEEQGLIQPVLQR